MRLAVPISLSADLDLAPPAGLFDAAHYKPAGTGYAIQKAIDAAALAGGGTVSVPAGVWSCANLTLPAYAPGGPCVSVLGAGMSATILEAARPDVPIFAGRTDGAITGGVLGGFAVRAHPGGSVGPAIDAGGWRSMILRDVRFLSYNAPDRGYGNFAVGVLLDSIVCCYGNLLDHLVCQEQVGPSILVGSANHGTWDHNANANHVRNLWAYGNRGMVRVLDLANTTLTTVRDSHFEANPNATAVVPGQLTVIEGCWFEGNRVPVECDLLQTVYPNGVRIVGNYFGPGRIVRPPGVEAWTVEGNAGGMEYVEE